MHIITTQLVEVILPLNVKYKSYSNNNLDYLI